MKNSIDLLACRAAPHPTASPRAPEIPHNEFENRRGQSIPAQMCAHAFSCPDSSNIYVHEQRSFVIISDINDIKVKMFLARVTAVWREHKCSYTH